MSRRTFNLGPFLELEKLKTDGSNFTTWFCTLRILLAPHKISYVLEAALGDKPSDTAPENDRSVYQAKADVSSLVQSGMLYAMESELQERFEKMGAYDIITYLKAVFAPQAGTKRYGAYAEGETKKEHTVLMVNKAVDFKKSGKKGKGKKPKRNGKSVAAPKAPELKPNTTCLYCKGKGHWKRSCTIYMEDKKAGKIAGEDMSIYDIHVIDVYLTTGATLGYFIPVLLVRFVTPRMSYRINGAWQETR